LLRILIGCECCEWQNGPNTLCIEKKKIGWGKQTVQTNPNSKTTFSPQTKT